MRPCSILILLTCLWSSTGCSSKPVVLPDSHVLKPGIQCGRLSNTLADCFEDQAYVQISKGYLREIMFILEQCPVKER